MKVPTKQSLYEPIELKIVWVILFEYLKKISTKKNRKNVQLFFDFVKSFKNVFLTLWMQFFLKRIAYRRAALLGEDEKLGLHFFRPSQLSFKFIHFSSV